MELQKIIELVKEKGYKITPQRRTIIETLSSQSQPLTAKEILDRVRAIFPDISFDTVYRNLNLLAKVGIITQINLRSGESSKFEITDEHHHHFICLGCGESVCLKDCPLNEEVMWPAVEKGYLVTGHIYEVYGYCPMCRHKI